MDGNRDEADRCIEIAVQSLADGKYEKAEKFLKKAENLFPTEKAKVLLAKISSTPRGAEDSTDGARKRNTTSSSPKPETRIPEPDYTTEQLEAVKKIKKCKDFYEILGVTKESTDTDIKKAYKKLALQLHPDKNKAPGSIEAFKIVGNAAAILTDNEKRKSYDLYGADDQNTNLRARRGQNHEYAYARGFEADVTAEELFNMFFGGGFPNQQNVYMRQQRRFPAERAQQRQGQGQGEQQQSGYAALINLLPILLLITLSMMSSFFISDPIYNLQPSQKYSIARRTSSLKIPYYVKDNFHSEYQGSVGRLETSVEEEYLTNLKHACYRERNYKESMLAKARNFGDRELYKKAQNINTPSCDTLTKLQNS